MTAGLTDNHGNTVDFTNTMIVMTSNVGSQVIQRITEEGGDNAEIDAAVMQSLQARFAPELLNRVDEKIVFHPLSRDEIRKIVAIQVDLLRFRLADQNWTLTVDDSALDAIAEEGYDAVYGARPLKRVIQQRLSNPMATAILKSGDEGGKINVRYDGKEFVFEA